MLDTSTSSVQRPRRHNTQRNMHKQANKLMEAEEQLLQKLNMHTNAEDMQEGDQNDMQALNNKMRSQDVER